MAKAIKVEPVEIEFEEWLDEGFEPIDITELKHYAITIYPSDSYRCCNPEEYKHFKQGNIRWQCEECGDLYDSEEEALGCCPDEEYYKNAAKKFKRFGEGDADLDDIDEDEDGWALVQD